MVPACSPTNHPINRYVVFLKALTSVAAVLTHRQKLFALLPCLE